MSLVETYYLKFLRVEVDIDNDIVSWIYL